MPSPTHEVALIGAGPIGLELAVALKRANIPYLHLEARQIAHTIGWWAPQTRFFSSNERISIAGVPLVTPDGQKATREQYLAYLRSIVQQFNLTIHTFSPVTSLTHHGDHFTLTTSTPTGQHTHHARKVILATGGTETPNLLHIPGENLPHVSHYFQDPHIYFQKKLLIVGGRNSAAEAALRAHHTGAHVSLSYRKPTLPDKSIKYWILPELQSLLNSRRITPYLSTTPTQITQTHVTLQKSDGSTQNVPADFVLLLTGYDADMSLFQMANVPLTPPNHTPTFDPTTMQTPTPGLYVAGTAAGGTQQSKYELYIENAHSHVQKILAHLQGHPAPITTATYTLPES
jgi:thioredoxin reductase (NADPH)